MSNDGELIGSAEVAKRLGVDRSKVSRLVSAGRLTPVKKLPGIRGAYVFLRSEVEALAAEESAA